MDVIVNVGWTDRRPVVPDQRVSRVIVSVPSGTTEQDATWIAAAMVAARKGVEMVTSTAVEGQPSRRVPMPAKRRAEIVEAFACASLPDDVG